MDRAVPRKFARWFAPYPLAVQAVVLLALFASPLSGFGVAVAPWRFWTMLGLGLLHLAAAMFVPARLLPLWARIVYIIAQVALTATAQALAPPPLIGYVYLAIVLQAMALFRPWLWIPLAVAVYAVWSGLLIASGLLAWLQNNLALAFPATCAIIAAVLYLRQQRRSEQVQLLLQQVQQRYDSLAGAMRELQQLAVEEERTRLIQTVVDEVQTALGRAEQSAAYAVTTAQSNLARLQATVAQTRASAAGAVERLRNTVAILRLSSDEPEQSPPPGPVLAVVGPADEAVVSARSGKVLSWVLLAVFVALSLAITLSSQWQAAPELIVPLLLCSAALVAAYAYTQLTRNPLLMQAGLAAQIVAVVVMTAVTHTLPLLLGLLLVLWQLVIRLPLRQILLYLTGVPAALALMLARWRPEQLGVDALLMGTVAAVAVGAPLLLARRQLERRKQAELRVALLSAEIEQQTAEVRALAVASERSRLAREVHDDLGSRLVLINLQLQLAEELAADDAEAALEQLRLSREQLQQAWRGMLAVADAGLPIGAGELPAALRALTTSGPSGAPRVKLTLDGELDELDAPLAATIYRMVQEGLTNARKHAAASTVEVLVVHVGGFVTVTVANDGPVALEGAATDSFGLIGLRERAEALGGRLEAGPLAQGGWRIRAVLPAERS